GLYRRARPGAGWPAGYQRTAPWRDDRYRGYRPRHWRDHRPRRAAGLLAMDCLYQLEPVPGQSAAHPCARRQPHYVLVDRGGAARQEDPARARGAGPCDRVYGPDGPDADYYGLGRRELDRRCAGAGPLVEL